MSGSLGASGAEGVSAELRAGTRLFLEALVCDPDALAWMTDLIEESWGHLVGQDRVARLAETVVVMVSVPVMVRAITPLSADARERISAENKVALAVALSKGGTALDGALNDARDSAVLSGVAPATGDPRPVVRPRM